MQRQQSPLRDSSEGRIDEFWQRTVHSTTDVFNEHHLVSTAVAEGDIEILLLLSEVFPNVNAKSIEREPTFPGSQYVFNTAHLFLSCVMHDRADILRALREEFGFSRSDVTDSRVLAPNPAIRRAVECGSAEVIREFKEGYGVTREDFCKHSDVVLASAPAWTKSDPTRYLSWKTDVIRELAVGCEMGSDERFRARVRGLAGDLDEVARILAAFEPLASER